MWFWITNCVAHVNLDTEYIFIVQTLLVRKNIPSIWLICRMIYLLYNTVYFSLFEVIWNGLKIILILRIKIWMGMFYIRWILLRVDILIGFSRYPPIKYSHDKNVHTYIQNTFDDHWYVSILHITLSISIGVKWILTFQLHIWICNWQSFCKTTLCR